MQNVRIRSYPNQKTVDEYIADAPEAAQKHLREVRAVLKEVAQNADEVIKWGQPAFEEGRILFAYSAFKSHLNFVPTRTTLQQFKGELAGYKTGHDSIQLPYDKPVPKTLIKKIAKYRIKEVRKGALWKHKES